MKPPFPKYVICPDVEGLDDHLTAGKWYEVDKPNETSFCIVQDAGRLRRVLWTKSPALRGGDWIIPEDETAEDDPPEWAVRLACERAGTAFNSFTRNRHTYSNTACKSIKAHARTIAKHEQEPADPDLPLAREMAAQSCSIFDAARNTIKHIRKHGLPK